MDDLEFLLRVSKKAVERTGGDVGPIFKYLQKNITFVILMVNSECNAKCKHCYLPYIGHRTPDNTLETVVALQKSGYQVTIAGSETLLQPAYLKSYKRAEQQHLLTNGLVLYKFPSLYEKLRQHNIQRLVFSLHFGIDKELQSVPENIVAQVIKESKHRGFGTQITTTLTSKNYTDIREMCEKAISYGADRLYFGRFINMDRTELLEPLKLVNSQVIEFFERLNELRSLYDVDELDIRAQGYFGPRPDSIGEELAKKNCYCPAGTKSVAVDPDNNVYGCPFTMDKHLKIGKLDNGKIVIDSELLEKNLLCGKRDTCIAHLLH